MTVSPTLGITPINTAPISQFGAAASAQLQQFGAQLRDDITTIQGNEQLKNMAQQLQGANPNSMDGSFASQMTQAISQNPLGAHTPAGISILAQLGNAHTNYVQSSLLGQKLNAYKPLPGTSDLFSPGTGDVQQTGATPLRPTRPVVVGKGAGGVYDPNTGAFQSADDLGIPQNSPGKWKLNGGVMYNDTTGEQKDVTPFIKDNWNPVLNGDGSVSHYLNKSTGEVKLPEDMGAPATTPKPITLGPGAEAIQGGTVIGTNPKADSTQTRSNPAGAKLIDQHQKDVDSASDALADAATTFGIEDAKKQKSDAGKWGSGYDADKWNAAKTNLTRAQRNAQTAQQIFTRDQAYLNSPSGLNSQSSPLSAVPAIGNSFSGASSVPNQTIDRARAAIAAGASRQSVIDRLKEKGIDTTGL